MTSGNKAEIADHSQATINSARTQIQTMFADGETYGNERLFKKMDGAGPTLPAADRRRGREGRQRGPVRGHRQREAGHRAAGRDVKNTSLRASTEPIALRQSRATYEQLDNLYEGLRGNLENEGVWGKAAANQKRINEAWTAQIQADKQFRSTLAAQVGEERFGGRIYAADPGKVARYVSSLTNPEQDLVHKTISDYVQTTKNFVDAIGTSYDLDAGQAAKVARAKAAADAFGGTLKDIGGKLAKANQLKALMGGEGTSNGLLGMVLGHMVGGPLGGAVGGAIQQLASPGRNIMRLAQLEKVMGRVDGKMAGHVDSFFERFHEGTDLVKKAGKRSLSAADDVANAMSPHKTSPVKLAADTVKEHGKETAKAAILRRAGQAEGQETTRDRYEKQAKAVKQLADNPDLLTHRMAPHAATLQGAAPKVTAALAAQGAKAAGYLVSKLPNPPMADVLTGKPGIPTTSEQQRFSSITDTVLHPELALADLAKGRLTGDQVQAIQAVYPQMYAQMRTQVMAALTDHSAKGRSITYQGRVQLETLFDIESDPSMGKPAVNHAQSTFAIAPKPQQAKAPGDGKKLSLGSDTRTPAQAIEAGGT